MSNADREFARKSLNAALEEMAEIAAMQAHMAEAISTALREAAPLDKIVAATQAEDHIRQKQEHVVTALKAIREALSKGEPTDEETLARNLLAAMTLGKVKDRFSLALLGETAQEEDGDDIELF